MDITQIQKPVTQYVSRVIKKFKPEKVMLFGSFARGDATEWSDIDLLVIGKYTKKSGVDWYSKFYDLHKDIDAGHDFHVYPMTPQKFARNKHSMALQNAANEAVVLYGD